MTDQASIGTNMLLDALSGHLERRLRSHLGDAGVAINEPFLADAVTAACRKIAEHGLWPTKLSDLRITFIQPEDNLDGYAGFSILNPQGAEHPRIESLHTFERSKYLSSVA